MAQPSIRDYLVEGRIGAGGMGTVYLARHEQTGRRMALKVLHSQYTTDSSIRERFVNEARLMAQLDHPNIVKQYEFFEESSSLVLVMEYVPGSGLDDMIGREVGPIPWERALPLFLQVLEGMDHAHSKKIIHRDIKPANILVADNGTAKLTDFGIAKITGQKGLTKTGAKLGTIYYMSPEQVRGSRDVDHRADIYSLGMTLYEMLAGRVPFASGDTASEFEIMKSIVDAQIPDPREFYPHIPEELVGAVRKAIAPDPGSRFPDCMAMAGFLKSLAGLETASRSSDYWSGQAASQRSAVQSEFPSIFDPLAGSEERAAACPYCGKAVGRDDLVCESCGLDISIQCPECGNKTSKTNKFCPVCGFNIRELVERLKAEAERKRREREAREREIKRKREVGIRKRKAAEKERERERERKRQEALERKESLLSWWGRHRWKVVAASALVLVASVSCAYLTSDTYRFREYWVDGPLDDMTFSRVPEGTFMMGAGSDEDHSSFNEAPVHRVEVGAFEIMTTEVTQAMWTEVTGRVPSGDRGAGDDYPVYDISWHECMEFIDAMNRIDPNHEYRLPTEAEWEYACRAGTSTAFYWGEDIYGEAIGEYACCGSNAGSSTKMVAGRSPNAWGLYDMSGNVAEWCADSWHEVYSGAPDDGSAWMTAGTDEAVIRGGHWSAHKHMCRSAFRTSLQRHDSNNEVGFRLVRSAAVD